MKKQIIGLSLIATLLVGCSDKQEPNELQQLPVNLEIGKSLAQQRCISCHSIDGAGLSDEIPNLAAQLETYLLKAFQSYDHDARSHGSGDAMKVAEELSPSQLRNVLGYYAHLPPLDHSNSSKNTHYSYYDRGEKLSASCSQCHGKDGNPSTVGIPRLAGQHPQYIVKAAKTYQNGKRFMPTMHETLTGLSQADLENIALYFAVQTPKQSVAAQAKAAAGEPLTYDCTTCHGSQGSSQDVEIPNLAGQDVTYLNTVIKAYRDKVRDHGKMHKVVGKLNDSEVEQIATFFAAEKPLSMPFTQPEPIYSLVQKCNRCHDLKGANPDFLAPKLRGQHRGYLINALTQYRSGKRGSSAMHRMSAMYSDATIEGIATYYAAQTAQ